MNKMKKDDHNTSYVRYKLFKHDVYGLALEDIGNLVKSILVSSEFLEMIGGQIF